MSCNGCRVLRKGCLENCTLRPCLEWIESPQSQANATLFLAKFYGRAGLINLIKSGPPHLHPGSMHAISFKYDFTSAPPIHFLIISFRGPEIFRSLLYEACGRIISPVNGSVGLMCSGHWPRCQAAVEAVLRGNPLMMQLSEDEDSSAGSHVLPLQGCDIRHLSKDSAAVLSRRRARSRSKRSSALAESGVDSFAADFMNELEAKFTITGWNSDEEGKDFGEGVKRARSHDSYSVETVEPALVIHGVKTESQLGEIELDLTLGRDSSRFRGFASTVIEISDSEN